MKVIRSLDDVKIDGQTVVALGNFHAHPQRGEPHLYRDGENGTASVSGD